MPRLRSAPCALAALLLATTLMTQPAAAQPPQPPHQLDINALMRRAEAATGTDAVVREPLPTLAPDGNALFSPEVLAATRKAATRYSRIAQNGGWPQVPDAATLTPGDVGPAVALLRQRLAAEGDGRPADDLGPADLFSEKLRQALGRYQQRVGLAVDGIAGPATLRELNVPAATRAAQLQAAVARLNQLSGHFLADDKLIIVNIPAAEVQAVENGRITQRHRAVVGDPDSPSPEVTTRVVAVNLNPFWHMPARLAGKNLVPLAVFHGPDYFRRHGITVLTADGKVVDPTTVKWGAQSTERMGRRYIFRQDPGPANPLGQVRLNMPNDHSVYMHDTPKKSAFDSPQPFQSAGCVRVEHVMDLVPWLLAGTPGWSGDKLDDRIDAALAKTDKTTTVPLKAKVPVYWVYITAWAGTDGLVNFRRDIYGKLKTTATAAR